MSNRSGLPSLDELSEHIAHKILSKYYLHTDWLYNKLQVDEPVLVELIRNAILEISTQERENNG